MMPSQPLKILIVDDEPNILAIMKRTLNQPEYQVDTADDGESALLCLQKKNYDLLLLDLQMHNVGGIQVLKAAHQQDPDTVVIILTAHGSMESAVDALRLGAFDYIFKPASPVAIRERVKEGLAQRQKALSRRNLYNQVESLKQVLKVFDAEDANLNPQDTDHRFIRSGKLTMDRHHREAVLDGKDLDLTTTEFDLLVSLVEAAPKPVPARSLVITALGYECEDAEAREIIKWHIHQLRAKIEPDTQKPQYIKTVRYKGYMWSGNR